MNTSGGGSNRRAAYVVVLAMAAGILLAVGVAVGLTLAATASIDTFDEGQQDLKAGPNADDTAQGYVATTAAIGGERDAYVYNETGKGDVSLQIDYGDTNQASFSEGSNVRGWGEIVWDGPDNDAGVLDADGLGGIDLTDGGLNDGFQLLLYSCDKGFDLGIWVYSNTTTAYYTLTNASEVVAPGQSFFVKFSNFNGDKSVFTSTGAIVFRIYHATDTALDLSLDLFEATAETDFGDLPDTYSTTLASNGPRHIKGDLWLGTIIDVEANGFPSTGADGDDTNNYDDEDGIVRVPGYLWQPGNTVAISATVTGGSGDLYAWFDWDKDGTFSDEAAVSWTSLSEGEHRLTLTVDSRYTTTQDLPARFRLVPAGASSPSYSGGVTNGEVEDYIWTFSPTAVTLSDLKAALPGSGLPVVLLSAGLGIGCLGLLVTRKRRV